MKRKFLLFCVLAAAFMSASDASAVFLTFEDMTLNQVYNVGNNFTSGGVNVQVQQFVPLIGDPLNGTVKVDDSGIAGAAGKELGLTNVNLEFALNYNGDSINGVAFMFADQDGGINLGINGDIQKAINFTSLPSVIGGASIYVSGGYPFGIIMITGSNIQTVTIGGQKLYIDNILACKGDVPEPATIVLLSFGGLGLLIRKKKKGQAC